MVNVCLYSLTDVKKGTNVCPMMQFNRLMTVKLVHAMVKQVQVNSPQITYYLEEVCLQMRIGMIERSFVTGLV